MGAKPQAKHTRDTNLSGVAGGGMTGRGVWAALPCGGAGKGGLPVFVFFGGRRHKITVNVDFVSENSQ